MKCYRYTNSHCSRWINGPSINEMWSKSGSCFRRSNSGMHSNIVRAANRLLGSPTTVQRYPFRVARLSICALAPWPTSDAPPSASAKALSPFRSRTERIRRAHRRWTDNRTPRFRLECTSEMLSDRCWCIQSETCKSISINTKFVKFYSNIDQSLETEMLNVGIQNNSYLISKTLEFEYSEKFLASSGN